VGAIRSVLWIGRASDFPAGPISEIAALDVVWERDPQNVRALAASFDAVVLDAADADSALRDLALVRDAAENASILVRLDARSAHRQVELETAGAADVLLRLPGSDGHEACAMLLDRLGALSGERPLRPPRVPELRPARSPEQSTLVGESSAMGCVFALVERAAASHATVLVSGETGTGKELIASALHRSGPRRDGPFIAFNCAAVPESLLESELLGHTRGAFTGADRDRKGLAEEAHGGTLFLDEVGEAAASLQAKLLRFLQERAVRPLGGSRERRVDARIVAATNRDLRREVAAGRFREDLYYRLAVFPIPIPPLRERPEDLPALVEHFLARHGRAEGKCGCRVSDTAMRLLAAHPWRGNVRELENEIQRALVLAEPGETLEPVHFSERIGQTLEVIEASQAELKPGETLHDTLTRIEAWLLRRALDTNHGHRVQTARQLGITREGLYKKMKRFGIA